MSDTPTPGTPLGAEAPPEPLPVPPAPSGPRDDRRRRRTLAVAMALMACAAIGAGAVFLGLLGSTDEDSLERGATRLAWADEGRWAVVEGVGSGETSSAVSVTAWSTERGAGKAVRGYRVAAVEPHAPVVWLVPAEGVGSGELTGTGSVWGARRGPDVDAPPDRLLAWRLDATGAPSAAAEARWTPWPGPRDRTAYLEIDVLKGVYPAALLFQSSDGAGEAERAAVPDDATTFRPVGWSPTGLYFAVIEVGHRGDSPELGRRALLFSAASGSLVASAAVGYPEDARTGDAFWDREEDLLWLIESRPSAEGEEDGGYGVSLSVLEPREGLAPGRDYGAEPPSSWDRAWMPADVLGSDEGGTLIHVESEGGPRVWRLTPGGLAEVGEFHPEAEQGGPGTYSPRSELLVYVWGPPSPAIGGTSVEFSTSDAAVGVADVLGNDPRVIWSPEREGR